MKTLFLVAMMLFAFSCKKETETQITEKPDIQAFIKGADVGWLPQMEATGYKFYNKAGKEEDCLKILKSYGINAVRLRTFVNPSTNPQSGHCSKDEVTAMAVRAKKEGMKVMINFHYSDSWADPAKQVKPQAWVNLSFEDLKKALYDYTLDVISTLINAGVEPDWVQVGNEITPGLLLPEGDSGRNFPQLAALLNQGYDAVKKASPTSKVILHVDQGNNNARFRWWFDNATQYNVKYDIIGMSYYPYWLEGKPDYTESIEDLAFNLKDMVQRYGKAVMVVEVGGEDGQDGTLSAEKNAAKIQNTHDLVAATIQKVREVPDSMGLGVFYWEPQGARSWSHYALSAWGNDGRPTKIMDAFLEK